MPFRLLQKLSVVFMLSIKLTNLTLFDMGFFELSVMGGGHEGPHHNFVVAAPMSMKFGT